MPPECPRCRVYRSTTEGVHYSVGSFAQRQRRAPSTLTESVSASALIDCSTGHPRSAEPDLTRISLSASQQLSGAIGLECVREKRPLIGSFLESQGVDWTFIRQSLAVERAKRRETFGKVSYSEDMTVKRRGNASFSERIAFNFAAFPNMKTLRSLNVSRRPTH